MLSIIVAKAKNNTMHKNICTVKNIAKQEFN